MQDNRFEQSLNRVRRPHQLALLDVMDTAHLVQLWFLDHGYAAEPEHVIAMTRLILDREAVQGRAGQDRVAQDKAAQDRAVGDKAVRGG
ncbi:hypothetical protein [Acuticoccus sediminis]|uniref:hypothetical protein n=1 Tax=Acuticoccus sediminis TaxID=2184697 RepID=UPI001CFC98CF|nr:hypothetical protein [Acuticoccus sediminis]